MNKEEILYRLHQEDIMRKAHNHLVDSLVGVMHNEYIGQTYDLKADMHTSKPLYIFRAVVNMLVSQVMHHFSDTILDRMVDLIVDYDRPYHELLMAVEQKIPGENRHETALRFITERGNTNSGCAKTTDEQNKG